MYFASASSFTGKPVETFAAPIRASALYDLLEDKYRGIKDKVLKSCAVTINLHYVDIQDDTCEHDESIALFIKEGDEVAIIPPVSSG